MTEKLQSLFILIAISVGLALGQIKWVAENALSFVVPSLTVMLYGVFLNIPLERLGNAFQNYKVTGLSLGINFLWTPVFAWGLGAIFLLIANLGNFSYEEFACFSCTTLARNSPISLAIATSAFPERPLVALALVIGSLIELPVMVLVSQFLLVLRRRRYSSRQGS